MILELIKNLIFRDLDGKEILRSQLTLQDIDTYKIPIYISALSVNSGDHQEIVPAGRYWILAVASISNSGVASEPRTIIQDPTGNSIFTTPNDKAAGANKYADALMGVTTPLVLPPGTLITFRDSARVAPQTCNFTALVYEVSIR